MDILKSFLEILGPATYRLPAFALLAVIATLAIVAALPNKKIKSRRPSLVLWIVVSALLLTVLIVDVNHRWQWIVGLLPMLLVGYQAFFLMLYHPKPVDKKPPDGQGAGLQGTGPDTGLKEVGQKRAEDAVSSHFGWKVLSVRYGLPAAMLGIAGIVTVDILVDPQKYFSLLGVVGDLVGQSSEDNVKQVLRGVRLGAIGAYVYVLLELGRRTFRHDVTGASAMWCLVTLVLGPTLAGVVSLFWRIGAPPTDGWWGSGVVLFFAGFAPRRVIAAIEQAALQMLKMSGQSGVVESRLIPLTKIRGIGSQIEDRLSEEGILDVNSLAAAEPVRLVRNTAFDMRLILSWIDEAILMVTLPKGWEALELEGVTGAVDLAWYYEQMFDEKKNLKDLNQTPIPALAKKADIQPENLAATIQRLYEDTQVQYIWALYDRFTEYSGGQVAESDQREDRSSGSSPALLSPRPA